MDSFLKNAFIVCLFVVILSVFGVQGAAVAPETSTQVLTLVSVPFASPDHAWSRVTLGDQTSAACPFVNQTWHRNGTVLPKSGSGARVFQSGTAVIINNFEAGDAGRYDCVDVDGNIGFSHTFYQNVVISADTPAEQEVSLGSVGSIACQVLGSNVAKTLFRVVNASMTAVKFVNGNSDWTQKMEKSDAGEYVCRGTQVINGDEKSVDKKIRLVVRYNPEIRVADAVVSGVYPDRSITLSCPTDAAPAATVTWVNVTGGSEQELQNASIIDGNLTFPLTNHSSHNVTCMATNDVGSSSRSFSVTRLESDRPNVYPNVTSMYKDVVQRHTICGSNGTTIGVVHPSAATNARPTVDNISTGTRSCLSAFLGLFLMVVFAF